MRDDDYTAVRETYRGKDWTAYAECNGEDPEWWFPTPHDLYTTAPKAVSLCNSCMVRTQCLTEGIHNSDGIWAAWFPEQRKRLKDLLDRLPAQARQAVLETAARRGPSMLKGRI